MAWDWLDAARYADSNGYQGDGERTMWPWRDWVVRAFNGNMPFDQFTSSSSPATCCRMRPREQKLATGFNRNHMINGEGGRIAEENRVDYVMDMAETDGHRLARPDVQLLPLPRPQVRPAHAAGLLRLFAFFNQTPVDGGGGNPQTPPVLESPTEQAGPRAGRASRPRAAGSEGRSSSRSRRTAGVDSPRSRSSSPRSSTAQGPRRRSRARSSA